MVGPCHYKWYQSRSPTPMSGSVPFGSIRGCLIVWPRNPMGHNENIVSTWGGEGGGGGGCLSHPTSERGKTSCHYLSRATLNLVDTF